MQDLGRRIMKLTVIILGQSLLAVVLPGRQLFRWCCGKLRRSDHGQGNVYEKPIFTYLTVLAVLLLAFLIKTLHFDFDEGHKSTDFARSQAYAVVVFSHI